MALSLFSVYFCLRYYFSFLKVWCMSVISSMAPFQFSLYLLDICGIVITVKIYHCLVILSSLSVVVTVSINLSTPLLVVLFCFFACLLIYIRVENRRWFWQSCFLSIHFDILSELEMSVYLLLLMSVSCFSWNTQAALKYLTAAGVLPLICYLILSPLYSWHSIYKSSFYAYCFLRFKGLKSWLVKTSGLYRPENLFNPKEIVPFFFITMDIPKIK